MTLYSLALFVHIVGALALFALLGIEGLVLRRGGSPARVQQVLGPISALAIVVPGFYMAFAGAGWHAWAEVGLVSYIVIAVVGAFTGISVMRGRMGAAAATISWLARIGIALGVVFDMTVKPDAVASVAAVVVGVVIAMLVAVPTLRLVRAA